MEDIDRIVKDNIRYYRKRLSISQEKLSEMCNLSHTYIGEIEMGRRHPSLQTIAHIASALEIKSYQLLIDQEKYKSDLISRYSEEVLEGIKNLINDTKKRY